MTISAFEDDAEELVMEFDAIVGNPPYQTGIINKANDAVYHHHFQAVKTFGNKVSLIMPARWLTGGRGEGMGDFREQELSSNHYTDFILNPSTKFFENVEVKAGICYFLWDKDKSGSETMYTYYNNTEHRNTLLNNSAVFIRDSTLSEVVNKIRTKSYLKPTGAQYYGANLSSDYKIEALSTNVDDDTTVRIHYSGKGGGVRQALIPADASKKDTGGYKVFVSMTAHGHKGKLHRPDRIFTGTPDEICSTSFIAFNHLESEDQTVNLLKYLKTDFSTFLLGILTPTQHAYAKVYKLIPDVDFGSSVIKDNQRYLDFSGNSDDIDDQLADIYQLTKEERTLIHNSITTWKDKNNLAADGML